MKFFDLHNDILTSTENPYKTISEIDTDFTMCTAVYKGNLNSKEFKDICETFILKNIPNLKLCFEDIGYDDLTVDDILKYKPFYAQLTYNEENKYGYGCNFNENLKPLGVTAVKSLTENGVYVDVSHLSEKGALQVCELTDKVICSHTLLKSVYDCKRNISDELVENIIARGGIIGFCLVGFFVEDGTDINSFFNHVDYFINKFGCDNLAIGSDFYGTDNFVGGINGYDKVAEFYNRFIKRGYGEDVVQKIFSKNVEVFLKKSNKFN